MAIFLLLLTFFFCITPSAAYATGIEELIITAAAYVSAAAYAGEAYVGLQTFIFYAVEVVLTLAVSVGLSYASKAIQGGTDKPAPGVRQQLAAGGDVPRSFIVGHWPTAGSLVYANTWTIGGSSVPNTFLVFVICLSDIPITGLTGLVVNEKRCTYNTGLATYPPIDGYSIPEFEQGAEQYMWARFYNGTQTSGNTYLNTKFGSDPLYPWDTAAVGYGCAYAILTFRYNPSMFPGLPQVKFECDGITLYDQRLDSTAGGSGSQRFATHSTWAYSANPIVGIHNILRGVSYNGSWLYGLQNTAAGRIPSSSLFAAANECDASINDAGGSPQSQFKWGAEVLITAPPIDIITGALQSCNGRMSEAGGLYKFSVGAAGASVYNFSDADIMIEVPQQFLQFPSRNDIYNGIAATYAEPAESWNTKDAPVVEDTSFQAQDGGRFISDVTYTNVSDISQVQRLQQSALSEGRKFRRHIIGLPPPAWLLEPNDIIGWTSPKNGYTTKLFRVNQITDTDKLDVPASISEVDPADYDFDPDNDYLDFTNIPISDPAFATLQAPTNFTVTNTFRGLILRWQNVFNFDLIALEIWRSDTVSFGDATKVAEVAPYTNSWTDEGLDTNIQKWYWIRYRNVADVYSLFTPLSSGAGATAKTDILSVNEMQRAFIALQAVQRLLDYYSEIAIGQTYKTEHILPGLVAGVSASVTREETLRATADSAMAELIEQVTAIANDATASATIRWVAAAGPVGVVARLALESRITVGDAYTQAGIYIDAITVGMVLQSQITLDADYIWLKTSADRVLLSDGGISTALLAINSATILSFATGSDLATITNDASYHDLVPITYTSEGSPTIISPSVLIRNDDNTTHGIFLRLLRDGTRIWPASSDADGAFQLRQSDGQTVSFNFAETPGTGSHTYKYQYKASGSANLKCFSPVIQVVEIKR